MRITKEKRKVNIVCREGIRVEGVIHINPGERVLDFINDKKKSFIIISEVKVSRAKLRPIRKYSTIILNKASIEWIEEI